MKTFIIKRPLPRGDSAALKLVNYVGIFVKDRLSILKGVLSDGGYSNSSLLQAQFTKLSGERERTLTLIL